MNLGVIYLKTFLAILGISFVLSMTVTSSLRFRGWSWRAIFFTALPIWLMSGFFMLDTLHQEWFAIWHRSQNTALPTQGCLTYEPEFTRLYATYSMSRENFESWVSNHPWPLQAGRDDPLQLDANRLGFEDPELSYLTQPAPNGKQLRVYYKSGVAFVSYNAN